MSDSTVSNSEFVTILNWRKRMLNNGEFIARINGLKLWYKVSGTGPVCIIPTPGWGPSSDLYFRPLKPLEELFTLVYLDTRGAGRSEKPSKSTDYTYAQFSADLDGLRKHLGQDKVWVMGHSAGGVHVTQYALNYPQGCQGLILLDSLAARDDEWQEDVDVRMMERKNEPWFGEAMKAWNDEGFPESDEAFAASLEKSLPFYFYAVANIERQVDVFSATTFSIAALRGSIDSNPSGFDILSRLTEIKVPTLIVVGNSDFICSPVQARRIHKRIAGSELIVIDKAGHFPWLEQPDEFFSRLRSKPPPSKLGGIPSGMIVLGAAAPKPPLWPFLPPASWGASWLP